jgi:hypothetical protein
MRLAHPLVIAEGGSIQLHWMQRNFALGGRITLHWVAELIAFSKQPGLGAIKHLRAVIAPVADGRVSRLHNHLVRVVGMEKIERRARVASFVVDA